MFHKSSLLPSSCKEAPNLVDPLDWVILSQWAPQKQQLVMKRTWEQIKSTGSNGKISVERLKTTTRLEQYSLEHSTNVNHKKQPSTYDLFSGPWQFMAPF